MLSEDAGKLSAAARGARNPKSKLAAVAQPFTLAKFLIARGRSLDIVSQAETERAHTHLAGDLLKTAWASYFCELCDAIPEELPENELFKLLEISLARLDVASNSDESEIVGRWFEAQYLQLLGYAITIGRCVACGEKISVALEDTQRAIFFSPSMGGTLCGACALRDSARLNLKVQALRALHQLGRASAPPEREFWERWSLTSAARRDLREALQRSVFSHLDIRLKSRAFLDEVLASQPGIENSN
jgi:DNA repair protein RecO (recombination protein O)